MIAAICLIGAAVILVAIFAGRDHTPAEREPSGYQPSGPDAPASPPPSGGSSAKKP